MVEPVNKTSVDRDQRKRDKERKKLREEYQKKFPMVSQTYSIQEKNRKIEDELEEINIKYGKKGVAKVMNSVNIGIFGIATWSCFLLAKSMPNVWLFWALTFIFGASVMWSIIVLIKCIQMDKRRVSLKQTLCENEQKLEAIKHIITFEEWLELKENKK